MWVLIQELRRCNIRELPYLDDFLIAPSNPGTVSTPEDCLRTTNPIDALLRRLGLVRHPTKGEWTGTQTLVHLGVEIDTATMRFRVISYKLLRIKQLATDLLHQARVRRHWVSQRALSHFC